MDVERDHVSELMQAFRGGDREAGAKLTELFYPELKRMAARHLMRERPGHSWQPTLLVNELYLELSKIKALRSGDKEYNDDKAAFFALAGHLMRRLLIHHARPLSHKAIKVPVWEDMQAEPEQNLTEIDSLLAQLEAINPAARTVLEFKVFEGCTAEEIAKRMGCAPVTVHRHWKFAKRWLETKME
jgi:RNA polymerase sigma factor (TIGR02999 family)